MLLHLNKWNMATGGTLSFNESSGALRVGEWKLMINEAPIPAYAPAHNWTANCTCEIVASTEGPYLYNIIDDPYEKHNLYDDHPLVARRLTHRLHDYYHHAPDTSCVIPSPPPRHISRSLADVVATRPTFIVWSDASAPLLTYGLSPACASATRRTRTRYVPADEKAYYVWMATGGFIVPWNGTSGNGCDVQTMDEC